MAGGQIRLPQLYGGVCVEDLPYKLRDNQAEKMINMWANDRILTKRWGLEYLNDSLGASGILACHDLLYKGFIISTWTTKMNKTDPTTGITTEIGTGLTATKGDFIEMNGILYYRNGSQVVQWDGTTFSSVVGYIPYIIFNRTPAGGGTLNEQLNRYSSGWRITVNGNGVALAYTLPFTSLDATTLIVTIGGVSKTEGVDFTVVRATGVVNFSAAPITGVDNVSITAFKTTTATINTILNCKFATVYGGESSGLNGGSRMFIAGNVNFKNYVYYSGILDPTYWPDNQYLLIGSNDDEVTQFGKQYNFLAAFKTKSVVKIGYTFDGSIARFPIETITDRIGCDMPDTIQLVENKLVWCNSYRGMFIMTSTDILDERNIQPISQNINGTSINPGILAETNKTTATSMDFQGKYWICIGSKVWVWDYSITPYSNSGNSDEDQRRLAWFPMDNINSACFFFNEQTAYYGDRTVGRWIKFNEGKSDFVTTPINAYWKSKSFDMGYADYIKTVLGGWLTGRTDTYSRYTVTVYSDKVASKVLTVMPIIGSASWDTETWDGGIWDVLNIAKTIPLRFRLKKISFFAIKFSNNELGQDLAISDLVIQYNMLRPVRK